MLTESERAAMTAQLRRGRKDTTSKIPRRPAGLTDLPLSYGQEQLWFLDRFAPGMHTYNIPFALRLSGPLDAGAMSRAVDALVARHEALRTRLVTGGDGRPVQAIDIPPPTRLPSPPHAPSKAGVLEMVDLSGTAAGERQGTATAFINAAAVRPFSLADGPLLRTWLLRLADGEHLLLVVVHHAVFDGWSIGVFVRELAALYRAEVTGEPSGLGELPVQFADYALWERGRLQGAALAELEEYWRGVMAGFPTVQLPTDRPRPLLDAFDGGIAAHRAGPELLDGLRELSRREGATLFATLVAGLFALLHRYTGQADLVVGTPSANRAHRDLAPLIGFLVNTLPVRGDVSGDPVFTELLARVREATTGAYAHQDLPFARMVETLQVERDPSRTPVFQITLNYARRDYTPLAAAGVDFALSPADLAQDFNSAKFDLDLSLEASADGLKLTCSYKTGLFDAETVQRFLRNWEVLLAGVVADPGARVSALPVLTPAELRAELVEWNDTAAVLEARCVHELFEAQAARTPDAVAARFEAQAWSYAQLNARANQLARRLQAAGDATTSTDATAGPEAVVGVCMAAGLDRLAVLLGIWKAGGGYAPLDPALPADRMGFLIADTGMSVLVADEPALGGKGGLGGTGGLGGQVTLISPSAERGHLAAPEDADLAGTGVSPANVAYVIYTSGSTGQPKGVVVEHRNAANFLHGMLTRWQVSQADVMLQFCSFTFDVSVLDTFLPLLAGASLVLASEQTRHSPPRLAALIRAAGITFACPPPAVLSLLTGQDFPGLRVLLTAGEELPPELARAWTRPGLRFVNGYGPTEATVLATYAELDGSAYPPPIGRPVWPNYQAYVLDSALNPVPAGVTGELYIGGAGVARGYLNRPGLTAQRFIADPFATRPGTRLYKTGDLVRRRADGSIVFLGRTDDQVKIRGLRIELGEIETALHTHPRIAQAAITVVTDPAGDKQLAAYLRPEPGGIYSPALAADVRAHLARTLPDYMIPAHLITIEEFPLNASGKINRAALPPPQARPASEYAAPATPLEISLAGMYAAVLGRDRVGATDSFFDLGGSSLQVMRLIDLISRELGADVGVPEVFLQPTPRQLAASIAAAGSQDAALADPASLVPLTSGPGELPLFLIHAVGGTVFAYAQLARQLAATFRVYGLQAPGLSQEGATAASLAALADDYSRRIRAAQPAGPYRLAGWSMGGVIAFEIARRLEAGGQEVSLLALLDAPFAISGNGPASSAELAGQFVADATRSLGWDAAAGPPDPATTTAAAQLDWLAARMNADYESGADGAGRDGGAHQAATAAQLRRRFEIFSAHVRMLAGYRPQAAAVRAPALIVSADHSPNAPCLAQWPAVLAGSVATRRLASDHYALLRAPLVTQVSSSVLDWQRDCG